MYEYIINRFTPQKTAYIAQFGTIKTRGAIDVLARGLNYQDLEQVKAIKNQYEQLIYQYSKIIQAEVNLEELEVVEARSIDFGHHDIYIKRIRNKDALDEVNQIKKEFDKLMDDNQDLFYYFDGIQGTIISKGNHPAGIIGSPITLADHLGVFYKDGNEDIPISQCAMVGVEYCNFVKFDILGLKTLGILKDAYRYAGLPFLKSHEIDWHDKEVWGSIIKSRVGIFQFEGDYAFSLLKQFKPQSINDMSLVNAALRPSGKSYRDELIAKKIHKNPSSEIDELLKENYGYLVYQEDTIKFLSDICGMSGSEADSIRRAIGNKDRDAIEEALPRIIEGYCDHSQKDRSIAEDEVKEFIQIIEDSSEYQFGLMISPTIW